MKNISIFLLSFFLSINISFAQDCLPNGISLKNQAEVDNFITQYSDCIEIKGDVFIGDSWPFPTNITNLDALSNLVSIRGQLKLSRNANLINLSGLNNLESIDSNLIISNNENLVDLSGLESLKTIHGCLAWKIMRLWEASQE